MIKNIDKAQLFNSRTKDTGFGKITILEAMHEVSEKGSIFHQDKTLLASYVYDKDGGYKLVYTTLDTEGNEESFVEDDGILPTLFLRPDGENYVSLVPYHPDKELEISIPVFHRENIEIPKSNRPFTGDFIGVSDDFSIFYDVDPWSESKPDKMLAVEFKNNVLKKKHNIKVPLPRNNKIYIADSEIHLLAKENKGWLHRQIDAKGNEVKRRDIKTKQSHFWQIIGLSFDKESYVLSEEYGKISLERIDIKGQVTSMELTDIKDPLYNTWRPVRIGEDTFVTRFNNEFGNGWITIRKDTLLELFYSKGEQGYKDLVSGKILEMDDKDLIISSFSKTTENAYAVVFYPRVDRGIKNTKLLVLNRELDY